MACHASANLDLAIPGWTPPVVDPTKGQKGVGTQKHKILESVIDQSPKDLMLMVKVLQYVSDLRQTRRFNVLIEEEVKATWLTTAPSTTADLVLFTQDEIHVIDYKWGRIPVSVHDNAQLKYYAVCYSPLAPLAKGVTVHILQPYADVYESEFLSTLDLQDFMAEAQHTETQLLAGDLTFGPSDHCTFCPANPHSRSDKGSPKCPVMLKLLYPPVVEEDEILNL